MTGHLPKGECNVCGMWRPLVQDHDHLTGHCRPKTCNRCNVALGWYERNVVAIHAHLDGPQGEPYADVVRRRNAVRMRKVYVNQRADGTYSTPEKRAAANKRQRAYRDRQRKGVMP